MARKPRARAQTGEQARSKRKAKVDGNNADYTKAGEEKKVPPGDDSYPHGESRGGKLLDEYLYQDERGQPYNFSSYLERMLDELFIDRMEGNEEIFSRVMTDKQFRSVAHEHLAREIFRRIRDRRFAD
jgi:hypothetical protein